MPGKITDTNRPQPLPSMYHAALLCLLVFVLPSVPITGGARMRPAPPVSDASCDSTLCLWTLEWKRSSLVKTCYQQGNCTFCMVRLHHHRSMQRGWFTPPPPPLKKSIPFPFNY